MPLGLGHDLGSISLGSINLGPPTLKPLVVLCTCHLCLGRHCLYILGMWSASTPLLVPVYVAPAHLLICHTQLPPLLSPHATHLGRHIAASLIHCFSTQSVKCHCSCVTNSHVHTSLTTAVLHVYGLQCRCHSFAPDTDACVIHM